MSLLFKHLLGRKSVIACWDGLESLTASDLIAVVMGVYGALICHVWVSTSFSETTESRGVKIGRKSPQRGNGYWAHKIFTTLRIGDKQVKDKTEA